MEPPPGPGTQDAQSLTDAGALESGDGEKQKMGEVAQQGDARLRQAEERTDVGAQGDALSPASGDAPITRSGGRSESAGGLSTDG